LRITVYGPLELFNAIGLWFQEYDVYLQDPQECYRDARYCNPHKLSTAGTLESCPLLSEIIRERIGMVQFQEVVERPDLLDVLSEQDDLEETEEPNLIKSTLHRYPPRV
jgi:hypothetical protein